MMGYSWYLTAFVLIGAFVAGCLFGVLIIESRRFKAMTSKSPAIAQLISLLEQIITDWDGDYEKLNALIALEHIVLYNEWEKEDVKS